MFRISSISSRTAVRPATAAASLASPISLASSARTASVATPRSPAARLVVRCLGSSSRTSGLRVLPGVSGSQPAGVGSSAAAIAALRATRAIPAAGLTAPHARVVARTATEASGAAAAAADEVVQYSKMSQWSHWIGAAGMMSCIGLALGAQQLPNPYDPEQSPTEEEKELRGNLMHLHESIGILMLAFMVPRVGLRLFQRAPKHLPGVKVEHWLATASHAALYGMIIFMPVSGLAFGYFSGWGVPFFKWHIPGAEKEDQNDDLNQWFYDMHHLVGQALTYMVPLHIGAAFVHLFRGHSIFLRMNPFVTVASKVAGK